MMQDEDGLEKPVTINGKRRILPPSVKIAIALVLAVIIPVATYHVVQGINANRPPAQFTPGNYIDFGETGPPASADMHNSRKGQFLRIAIAPIISPEMSITMYRDFVEYMSEKLDRKPEMLVRPTYAETNDLVRYSQCDIAVVCTYPFIRGEREFGMQALAIPQVRSETTYNSLIIVPRSSPAASLPDLRGKRFASADIISSTGWLYPAMRLMEIGEDPNRFFGEHMVSGSHDRSVRALLNGYVDGAAVHSLVYTMMTDADPEIARKTRILEKSPPFGIPPIVANPGLDPALKSRVQSILLDMHNESRGKAILDSLQIDRFVIPEKDHYDKLRQAVGKLEGWR